MIEQFTREELLQIAKELKENKMLLTNHRKSELLHHVLEEKGYKNANDFWNLFLGDFKDLRKSMFNIADSITNNYAGVSKRTGKIKRTISVEPDKAEEYSDVLSALVNVMLIQSGVKKKRGRKPNGR